MICVECGKNRKNFRNGVCRECHNDEFWASEALIKKFCFRCGMETPTSELIETYPTNYETEVEYYCKLCLNDLDQHPNVFSIGTSPCMTCKRQSIDLQKGLCPECRIEVKFKVQEQLLSVPRNIECF